MAHLKGMYLAKMFEAELYEDQDDSESDVAFMRSRAMKMAKRLRRDYFDHINNYGYEACCHIPRQHGDVISLLTEIVEKNNKAVLFRTPSSHRERESSKTRNTNNEQKQPPKRAYDLNLKLVLNRSDD